MELRLQTRDPVSGSAMMRTSEIEPSKIGIVVIDFWDWHWCKTYHRHLKLLAPSVNRTTHLARALGALVLWIPDWIVANYADTKQRHRAIETPRCEVKKVRSASYGFQTGRSEGCLCKSQPQCTCPVDRGPDGQEPDLQVGEEDYYIDGQQELYSVCIDRGLTHLIYAGGSINQCLFGRPCGMKSMLEAGFECVLARDLSIGWAPNEDSIEAGHAKIIRGIELGGIPTVEAVTEFTLASERE